MEQPREKDVQGRRENGLPVLFTLVSVSVICGLRSAKGRDGLIVLC